jgi:hypothetical protein
VFCKDGLGLFAGQTGYVGDGIFVGVGIFGDVGGKDLKGETGLGEEFAASWGCGGQDEHRLIMPWTGVESPTQRAVSVISGMVSNYARMPELAMLLKILKKGDSSEIACNLGAIG